MENSKEFQNYLDVRGLRKMDYYQDLLDNLKFLVGQEINFLTEYCLDSLSHPGSYGETGEEFANPRDAQAMQHFMAFWSRACATPFSQLQILHELMLNPDIGYVLDGPLARLQPFGQMNRSMQQLLHECYSHAFHLIEQFGTGDLDYYFGENPDTDNT